MYEAKIIEDSIAQGVRLTTICATFPRFILAEFNTHRVFSRNSASSRAIPVLKRVKAVWNAPFIPDGFAANKAGMQAGEEVSPTKQRIAYFLWWLAAKLMCMISWAFAKLEVHKQWANRLIEVFGWHTVVVTSTEWENFYALRDSSMAQPEIRIIAQLMEAAMKASTPKELKEGEWHLPFITYEERLSATFEACGCDEVRPEKLQEKLLELVKSSTARCARTSYETHEGTINPTKDYELYGRLTGSRHSSPLEHPARVGTAEEVAGREFIGNFRSPWIQHRKDMPGEAVAPREGT